MSLPVQINELASLASLDSTDLIPASVAGLTKKFTVGQVYTAMTQTGAAVSVKEPRFGAVGNGVADDTIAFQAWITAINALGSAIAVIPPGTYNVTVPKSSTLGTFSNLKGLVILASGAVIADQQSYAGTDSGVLFGFSACKNVTIIWPKFTSAVTTPNVRGAKMMQFSSGCKGLDVQWEQTGGLTGVEFYRAATDPEADRTSRYVLRGTVTNALYPVNGQFSGDDGEVWLNTSGCLRNFFFYGCGGLNIHVRSKNQSGTSILSATDGVDFNGAYVDYYDRESDTNSSSAPVIQLSWQKTTACTIRDVHLHMNVKNPSGSPWGNTIGFDKLDNALASDTTARGHKLLNFTVSGIMEQVAGKAHFARITNFLFATGGTPDVVKNIQLKDLVLTGQSVNDDWSGFTPVLIDRLIYDHVNTDYTPNVANSANGRVIFRDCTAPGYTANQGGGLTYGDTGSAVVLIDVLNPAAASQADLTKGISADYDEYVIKLTNIVPGTNDDSLWLRVSEDGGSTFKSGGTDYRYAFNVGTDTPTNAAVGSAGSAQLQVSGSVSNTAADGGMNGEIRFFNPSSTSAKKVFTWVLSYYRSTGTVQHYTVGGGRFQLDNNAINAVRVMYSSGTITGNIALYGRRKS